MCGMRLTNKNARKREVFDPPYLMVEGGGPEGGGGKTAAAAQAKDARHEQESGRKRNDRKNNRGREGGQGSKSPHLAGNHKQKGEREERDDIVAK